MSVLKINRSLSELEFYHNATVLYNDMVKLLLRNFGVKVNKKKEPVISAVEKAAVISAFPYMEQAFLRMDQLEAAATLREYSGWLISHYRDQVIRQLEELMDNISDAFTAETKKSKDAYKKKALANCEKLIQVMQRIMAVLPVDVNKLIPYVDRIDQEIGYLNDWE